MKNRSKPIIIIILIAVISLLIPACDVLISPLKARTNPNDPNTTIQPPENVDVIFNTINNERGLDITWNWSNEGSESEVIGFVLIRKAKSVPSSVYDGTCIYVSRSTEDGYHFDTMEGNPDYPEGYTIYYAVYSYAAKWDENTMREDEKLTLDSDGTVRNLQNYNFNGPAIDHIDVWADKGMPVAEDGYFDNTPSKNTFDNNFLVASNAVDGATAFGCISFDLSSPPEGNIKITEIYLVLRTYNDGGSGSITVSPFIVDWNDGVDDDFLTLEAAGVVDDSYAMDRSINGGEFEQLWLNVTDIYNAWTDGSLTNYGLRLIKQELADHSWQFFTVEDGDESNWPRLWVFYMYE